MDASTRICAAARKLGFDLVGITPAASPPHMDAYRDWIARAHHGEMHYLARSDRVERRANPTDILPGARAIICVGLNYYPGLPAPHIVNDPSRGLISNYAWGQDYHDLIADRLERLAAIVQAETGVEINHRLYVDTGPVLERAFAARAGLGFIGKNTCLIQPKMGSWLFLGEILVDVELVATPQEPQLGCGTCRRCLDACPTGALVAPYILDARRCISYLTIELKGAVPRELRPLIGNHIFGCDVCQAVCPWQRFAALTREPSFRTPTAGQKAPRLLDLIDDLMAMDEASFRRRYRGSPILRARRAGLLRNVIVALGNWGDERAVPALARALTDAEPLVRGHAAWALGCIGGGAAREQLDLARQREVDAYTQEEVDRALRTLRGT